MSQLARNSANESTEIVRTGSDIVGVGGNYSTFHCLFSNQFFSLSLIFFAIEA
tara:strand:- start:176 stop:334 length:159 start_codon:yes stop_codon:yes gene_type:complete